MSYSKKIKSFFLKYWEIIVAAFLVAVGFLLGTSGNREAVLKKDKKAHKKASDEIKKGTDEAVKEFQDQQKVNLEEKEAKEQKADADEEDRKEELLKDPEKLDKILEEKYKLKKG